MTAATAGPPPTPNPSVPGRVTLAELLHDLGNVPTHRVRLFPYPGTATESDALRESAGGSPCELVDGTLVEKPVGNPESFLAVSIASFLWPFVRQQNLGLVTGPDGHYRMLKGNVRMPDVSFTRRDRLPNPLPQVGGWCPDLCIEILSPDNSAAEMEAKRSEYFAAGCRLVWEIDPRHRTATVFTSPGTGTQLDVGGSLAGDPVLPGFVLPLTTLFIDLDTFNPQQP